MTLKTYIDEKRGMLEPVILEFLKAKKEEYKHIRYLEHAIEKLEVFVTQGKMLRGILVLASIEMFGGTVTDRELHIAAALELTHSALLIHDDIMDNDLKRRGKPTIFSQYITESADENVHESHLYGISQGINVGDISLFFAYELLCVSLDKCDVGVDLLRFYSQELVKVGGAQMQDVAFGYSLGNPEITDILNVYIYKSGRYTFSLPLVMGALYCHTDKHVIAQLDRFGEKLGTIFQIKDDEIGIFGEEDEIGKPVGSDIRENKKTIYRALLFQKANETQLKFLNRIFGSEQLTKKEIEKVKKLLIEMGVIDEVEKTVQKLTFDVRDILSTLDITQEFRKLLNEFIEYNLNRSM